MKKILVIILIAILALGLTGCSWLGAADGNSIFSKGNDTVTVNFHNGVKVTSAKLELGEEYKADIPIRIGYYLTGYYSEPEGGTQYFDELGRSVSVWSEDYPTDVYAQWASVSGMKIYDVYAPDKTYEGGPGMDSSIGIKMTMSEFSTILVSGNLDLEVVVTISYRIWEVYTKYYAVTKHFVKIKDGKDNSADVLFSTSYDFDCSGGYQRRTLTFKCEARKFSSGYLYFYVSSDSGYLADEMAIKDFSLTAEFV